MLCILISAMALVACKKEKPFAPTVVFERPFAHAFFEFGDTIHVLAEVSHPNLTHVSATIVDANYFPVEEVQTIPFMQVPVRVNTLIVIENKRLKSGKHYVRIQTKTADGQLYNHFREISIGALALQSAAIYFACQNTDNTSRALYKRSNNITKTLILENGTISGLVANGFYGNVILAPSNFGNRLVFHALKDSVLGQEKNPTSYTDTFMEGLYRYQEQVYGLYSNGQIVGYAPDGIGVQMSFSLPVNFLPKKMLRLQNTLLIIAKRKGQMGKVLLFYNALTRTFLRQVEIGNMQTPIALLPYSQDDFVVLFNDYSGQAKWERYDLSGQFYAMPTLPLWGFLDAVVTTPGSFALATNQGVYNFKSSVSGFLPLTSKRFKKLVFDEVNSQIIMAQPSYLGIYTYPAMQEISYEYVSAMPIVGLEILYNK